MTSESEIRKEIDRLKRRLNELKTKQESLEQSLVASYKELTTPTAQCPKPPGLKGNLVDSEGFPRSDIDVHAIRLMRHERARNQTDHKLVMKDIETTLHKLHAQYHELRAKGIDLSARNQTKERTPTKSNDSERTAFAIVNSVAEGSPSNAAKLREGDLVVRVGEIDASNHRELKAVGDLIRRKVGKAVPVEVLRRNGEGSHDIVRLSLTPARWSGPGLLGCHILPWGH